MTLTAQSIGDNAQTPGVSAATYNPDQLIAGNLKMVTDMVVLGAGTLPRGAVLGQRASDGQYVLSAATASDGSQVPSAILVDAADASSNPVQAPVYLTGEFNANAITYDVSWGSSLPVAVAALNAKLRTSQIYLKTMSASLSSADPT